MSNPSLIPIVLAEHDAEHRHLMALSLAEAGYSLNVAVTGAEALDQLCRVEPPVVVIVNDHLPEIDGYQLLRLLSLKQKEHMEYHPILLTTDLGSALTTALRGTHNLLPMQVLVKPFHVTELLLAVEMAARAAGAPTGQEAR